MNIRLQQLNPTIGDFKKNVAAILKAITGAEEEDVSLLILPELTVCGYPPMDLLERQDFLESVYEANRKIAAQTKKTAVIFGTVTKNTSAYSRKCFNTALLAQGGEIQAEVHKTLLPTYDVFDELRYFEPNKEFCCVEVAGRKLGITICEDIWYNENDIQYHTYKVHPARKLKKKGAECIINISASPYTKTKPESRAEMLQDQAQKLNIPIFYANQIGANTEIIFDGDSQAVDSTGHIISRAPLFKEAFVDVVWDEKGALKKSKPPAVLPGKIELMFHALTLGLRDYLDKTAITDDVVIGLSGGIDSALVTCIAVEALGTEHVMAVTMPSEFSSEGSVKDSKMLVDNLNIDLKKLAIKDIYSSFKSVLEPLFDDRPFGVAEENLQTRIRGMLLMACSNKFGNMLLNTGNKSELATGYCTLYGDMDGGLGVISDLYKTEVYEMAHWLNNDYFNQEIIPDAILKKPPSAELRPEQKDSDSLPEYNILDQILKAYIEDQKSNAEIAAMGFDSAVVDRYTALVDRMEYKRFQAVPGLKISTKAFGTGRRWPIVQKWTENRTA